MKRGPCKCCLIGPICSTLCNDKINHLAGEAAMEENIHCHEVTLQDFIKQLNREGMRIRKIEVVDGIIERTTAST